MALMHGVPVPAGSPGSPRSAGSWCRVRGWCAQLCCLVVGVAGAAPAREEVIETCRAALAGDYSGIQAAACDWYVRPCGQCGVDAPAVPWCVPLSESRRAVAEYVVAGLAREKPQRPLAAAVEELLRQAYPCPQPP